MDFLAFDLSFFCSSPCHCLWGSATVFRTVRHAFRVAPLGHSFLATVAVESVSFVHFSPNLCYYSLLTFWIMSQPLTLCMYYNLDQGVPQRPHAFIGKVFEWWLDCGDTVVGFFLGGGPGWRQVTGDLTYKSTSPFWNPPFFASWLLWWATSIHPGPPAMFKPAKHVLNCLSLPNMYWNFRNSESKVSFPSLSCRW